jgi:microcystin-dependent protein
MEGIGMSDFYLGQIIWASFPQVPQGLTPCDGRLLQIQTNQALFALLYNRYGGDGKTTFALPDLRGRSPLAQGRNTVSGNIYVEAKFGGEETVTLTQAQVPSHTHTVAASTNPGTVGYRNNALSSVGPATAGGSVYNAFAAPGSAVVPLAAGNVGSFGGSGPHSNMQPYLALNAFIVTQGFFPARN